MYIVRFLITAFITLFVVLDPVAALPIFFGLTNDLTAKARAIVFQRAVVIAFSVALFFLIAGRYLLSQIGVSPDAFKVSGGVLLFLTAVPMLFGHRGGLMAPDEDDKANTSGDIAVFPLAIPLISGPGTLTTVLTLEAAADGSVSRQVALVGALILAFLATGVALRVGGAVLSKIGQSGANILTRVFGIILASLAAQFVLNGISGFIKGN